MKPERSLSEDERQYVLGVLNSERFVDMASAEVYATLLDAGVYLCSTSTMYRILRANEQVREPRNVARHVEYEKPELLATQPNELWSWDITKLKGAAKRTYYYLYVILDVCSRYVVGRMVAPRESAELASTLINANPFSESQYKTMKYRPEFPTSFGCTEDARGFCGPFFDWYNREHHHSGIALLTPEMVHYGPAEEVRMNRNVTLEQACQQHPGRFVRKVPESPDYQRLSE